MSRPTQHGGGQAGPPIAGEPDSFPTDAELARTLVDQRRRAALATIDPEGFPYASAVSVAPDPSGAPVVLISGMAEHTVNARGDERVSVLFTSDTPDDADPLSTARLTLVGRLIELTEPGDARTAYLEAHPEAAYYADFTDFSFWRLDIDRCRFIGGFGHMSWVDGDSYRAASPDPVAAVAGGIIEHMNDDHTEANLMYVQKLAGLDTATEATMVGIDRRGVTLQATTPEGPRMARLRFAAELTDAAAARPAVIALLEQARAVDGPATP